MSNFLDRHKKKSLLSLLWLLISKQGKGALPLLAVAGLAGYLALAPFFSSDSGAGADADMYMPWPQRLAAAVGLDRLLGFGKFDSYRLARRNANMADALRQAGMNPRRGLLGGFGGMFRGWGASADWGRGGRGGRGNGFGGGGNNAGLSGLDLVRGGGLPENGLPGWEGDASRGDVIKGGGSTVDGVFNRDDARKRSAAVAVSPDELEHGWVRSVQAGEFAGFSGGGIGANGAMSARLGGWDNVGRLSSSRGALATSAWSASNTGGGGGFQGYGGYNGYSGYSGYSGAYGTGGHGGIGGTGGSPVAVYGGGGRYGGGIVGTISPGPSLIQNTFPNLYGPGGGPNSSGSGLNGQLGKWSAAPTSDATTRGVIPMPTSANLDDPIGQLTQCKAASYSAGLSVTPEYSASMGGACFQKSDVPDGSLSDPDKTGVPTINTGSQGISPTDDAAAKKLLDEANQCDKIEANWNPTIQADQQAYAAESATTQNMCGGVGGKSVGGIAMLMNAVTSFASMFCCNFLIKFCCAPENNCKSQANGPQRQACLKLQADISAQSSQMAAACPDLQAGSPPAVNCNQ